MGSMVDYDKTRRDFRLEVPDRFNYTIEVVDRWGRDEPDKLALVASAPDGPGFGTRLSDELVLDSRIERS